MDWTDRSALSELFWTFDCALVFWAIVKYAGHRLSSTELKSALFAANCKRIWADTSDSRVRYGATTSLDRSRWTAHAALPWVFDFIKCQQHRDVLHEPTGNDTMGLGDVVQAGSGEAVDHRGGGK